jgi:hypothetical protein
MTPQAWPQGHAPHESTTKPPKRPKSSRKHLKAIQRRWQTGAAAPTSTPNTQESLHFLRFFLENES